MNILSEEEFDGENESQVNIRFFWHQNVLGRSTTFDHQEKKSPAFPGDFFNKNLLSLTKKYFSRQILRTELFNVYKITKKLKKKYVFLQNKKGPLCH